MEGRTEGEGRGEGGRQGGDWPRGIDATQTDRHNVIFPDCDIPWRYPPPIRQDRDYGLVPVSKEFLTS